MAIGTGTAMLGAAVIGGVASMSAADTAANAQERATDKQLALQWAQYNDWQETYGPIQDSLSEFYQELTPTAFIASGLQNLEKQYQTTQSQLQRSFVQRGIESPAQALLEQEAAFDVAESRAELRSTAPLTVATAQQGFLNQQVTNPATQALAGTYGQQAQQAGQERGVALNQLGQAIQTGVSGYVSQQQQQNLQQQNYANTLANQAGSYYTSGNAPLVANTPPNVGGWEMLK